MLKKNREKDTKKDGKQEKKHRGQVLILVS